MFGVMFGSNVQPPPPETKPLHNFPSLLIQERRA
jgi:hypothetical protein